MSKPNKRDCAGCRYDFYNHRTNLDGGSECWSFKTATVERRLRIPIDLPPPYKHIKPERTLSCWSGYRVSAVKPVAIAKDGYWQPLRLGVSQGEGNG